MQFSYRISEVCYMHKVITCKEEGRWELGKNTEDSRYEKTRGGGE